MQLGLAAALGQPQHSTAHQARAQQPAAAYHRCFTRQQPLPLRRRSQRQQQQRAARPAVLTLAMSAAVGGASVSGRMAELKQQGSTAFIPFLVACDPDPATTVAALKKLDEVGADVIELGVPYSDPLADGPTIQAAATRALQKGTTLDKVLAVVREATATIRAPIVLFTYYNPIMARGLDKFCQQAKEAGAAGLLVPDIPVEETDEIRNVAAKHGIELVLLVTPTTPVERMKRIAQTSAGFVYLVSVTGVTGMKQTMESRVEGLIKMLQGVTDKSVAVGFGVSRPEQAAQIKAWGAEGVISGSALVKALGEAPTSEEGLQRMAKLAAELRAAI